VESAARFSSILGVYVSIRSRADGDCDDRDGDDGDDSDDGDSDGCGDSLSIG